MYHINEVFCSLQGEGARVGTRNVFVRFSGCNLECDVLEPSDIRREMRAGAAMGSMGLPVDARAHGRNCTQHGTDWAAECEECVLQYFGTSEAAERATLKVVIPYSDEAEPRLQSRQAGFKCDTEFAGGMQMSARDLVDMVVDAWRNVPASQETGHYRQMETDRWVVLTGGEPALQLRDGKGEPLVGQLMAEGFRIAIETNGTVPLDRDLDWVCVSPKTAEHTLRVKRAHELKYVRMHGRALPRPTITEAPGGGAPLRFISVAHQPDGRIHSRDLQWCVDLVQQHPEWRLTTQAHKAWALR